MSQDANASSGDSTGEKKKKNDEFYKYWDRFANSPTAPKCVIASLDTDQEGRPTHHPGVNKDGIVTSQNAGTSYAEAAKSCKTKVNAIVAECKRLNQKYYDRAFPLPDYDSFVSLNSDETPSSIKAVGGVGSVKRVEDIFEEPEFFEDGPTANDVRQGSNGDCWFLAGLTALSGRTELIERVCVARDEKVGVYGFVFYRDGEWISEVVDDRLCLKRPDDQRQFRTEFMITTMGDKDVRTTKLADMTYSLDYLPKEFTDSLRKGSNALFFASSRTSNETWLPLIEKAYAKAHGDYQAIEGGYAGEAVEDLTGGVANYISSEDVLDKDKLWGELLQVNDKFLFGCTSRFGRDADPYDEEGFVRGHAYTVLEAREVENPAKKNPVKPAGKRKKGKEEEIPDIVRLLKIRNPWGRQEWNGKWSDGSKEWTPEIMLELEHTFGDDGIFWISYEDFLRYYPEIDRVKLFDDKWTITQQWTSINVPWTANYLSTKFTFTIGKASPVVIVLSQPDDRYFRGLMGRYRYLLHFRLYKDGQETYLLRSMEDSGSSRSVSAELDLDAGSYSVFVKIIARRYDDEATPEEVIRNTRSGRKTKLLAVGKSFDRVHSKGQLRSMETANATKSKKDEKEKDRAEAIKRREVAKKARVQKRLMRERRRAERKKRREARDAKKKAEKEKQTAEKERQKAEKEKEKAAKTSADESDSKEGDSKDFKDESKPSGEPKKAEDEKKDVAKQGADADKAEDVVAGASTDLNTSTSAAEPTPSASSGSDPAVETEDTTPAGRNNAAETKPVDEKPAEGKLAEVKSAKAKSVEGKTAEEKSIGESPAPEKSEAKPPASEVKPEHPNLANEITRAIEDKIAKAIEQVTEEVAERLAKRNEENEKPEDDKDTDEDEDEDEDDDENSAVDSDIGDISDDDFDWDDSIDAPIEEESDTEEQERKKDDLFGDDPWRAICVVGLRLYTVVADVKIGVKKVGVKDVECDAQ